MPAALPDSARRRLAALLAVEEEEFARRTPRSRELFERARGDLLAGVPMSSRWAGPYPLYLDRAGGPS